MKVKTTMTQNIYHYLRKTFFFKLIQKVLFFVNLKEINMHTFMDAPLTHAG